MARFWLIHLVVLFIFLVATVESMANPNKTTQQPVVTTTKTEACRDRWTEYGTSVFLFCTCTQQCSINSASNKCIEKQAHLAKCNSSELEKFFKRSLNTLPFILLGGNDQVKDGTWRWPDRSLLNESYTNWLSGQPNGGKKENCLMLYTPGPYWYDWACDRLFPADHTGFVCEKKHL